MKEKKGDNVELRNIQIKRDEGRNVYSNYIKLNVNEKIKKADKIRVTV